MTDNCRLYVRYASMFCLSPVCKEVHRKRYTVTNGMLKHLNSVYKMSHLFLFCQGCSNYACCVCTAYPGTFIMPAQQNIPLL